MSSTEETGFGPYRQTLLEVARASVDSGLRTGGPLEVDPAGYPPRLRVPRASFVTLHLGKALRGCVGTLEPVRPLVSDVAVNAFGAAFRDPRFDPLDPGELEDLQVHVSVLSPLTRVDAGSEQALLEQLRPGIDGLVLREGARQGTFLPAVWESLPDPGRFLEALRRKAGLPPGHWSETLEVYRYTAESIPSE